MRRVSEHAAAKGITKLSIISMDGTEILASMPDKVLRALCGAGLERSKLYDPQLRKVLRRNRRNSTNRPCIYVMELTDDEGRPPTAGDAKIFIQRARQYMNTTDPSGDDIAVAVRIDGALRGLRYVYPLPKSQV